MYSRFLLAWEDSVLVVRVMLSVWDCRVISLSVLVESRAPRTFSEQSMFDIPPQTLPFARLCKENYSLAGRWHVLNLIVAWALNQWPNREFVFKSRRYSAICTTLWKTICLLNAADPMLLDFDSIETGESICIASESRMVSRELIWHPVASYALYDVWITTALFCDTKEDLLLHWNGWAMCLLIIANHCATYEENCCHSDDLLIVYDIAFMLQEYCFLAGEWICIFLAGMRVENLFDILSQTLPFARRCRKTTLFIPW